MCVNIAKIANKNKANTSLKISAICFALLCQNLTANAILANNERERERVTPTQNLSSFQTANHQTDKSTSVIANNDSAFVIVSSLDSLDSKLRGTSPQLRSSDLARKRGWAQLCKQNLLFTHCSVDCHESRLFNKSLDSRNDDGRVDCYKSANADSRNDENTCHTEGVARSISKSKNVSRDISRSRAQYDKENSVIASGFCIKSAWQSFISFDKKRGVFRFLTIFKTLT